MASLTGIWWGAWALSSAVTDWETAEEFVLEGGSAELLTPGDFAVYACWVGVVLVGAHLVMDRTWPSLGSTPSRAGQIAIALATLALAALLVLPVVPWTPLKLAALAWVIRRAFRGVAASDGTPTILDELAGRVRDRHLLLMLPVSASAAYAAMWPAREHDLMSIVFWSMVGPHAVAGVGGLVWAGRRQFVAEERRSPRSTFLPSLRTSEPPGDPALQCTVVGSHHLTHDSERVRPIVGAVHERSRVGFRAVVMRAG